MPTRARRKEYALSNVEEEGFEIRKIPQKEETHGDNYQTLQKVVMENLSLTKRLAATVKELQDENKLLKEEVARLKKEAGETKEMMHLHSEKFKHIVKDGLESFAAVAERFRDMKIKVVEKIAENEKEEKRMRQIRITGIKEKEDETPMGLKEEVEDIFEKKMKVKSGGSMIVDVFRVGRKGEDKRGRPRIVVVRLGSEWQRNQVLKGKPNLKDWKDIGVDFDRSPEEIKELQDTLKKKWEKKKKQTGQLDVPKDHDEKYHP